MKTKISEVKYKTNGEEVDLSVLCLSFTDPVNDDILLVPEGDQIDLTLENIQEYIDETITSTFSRTVNLQINAFKKGFNAVMPVEALKTFLAKDELEMLICGQGG